MLHGISVTHAYNHFSQMVTFSITNYTLVYPKNEMVKVHFSFGYLH